MREPGKWSRIRKMDDKWFQKNGITPPSHISHEVTDEELIKKMKPLKPRNWRLQGNQLIADTEMGPLVNIIDPSYILTGTDAEGLPILTKLEL